MHSPADRRRPIVAIVGQAQPRIEAHRPFARTRLFAWLRLVGIDEEQVSRQFVFGALVSFFPGVTSHGHKPPTDVAIAAGRRQLLAFLRSVNPDIVVPVGRLAVRAALRRDIESLSSVVGTRLFADPFGALARDVPVIPLPHPSGSSCWVHQGRNNRLLRNALYALAEEMGGDREPT
jgi:uracil-DNA glycosylase